ncbi:MAG: hypothetical protein ACYDAD_10065 [Acidimicrobiales bacterium]
MVILPLSGLDSHTGGPLSGGLVSRGDPRNLYRQLFDGDEVAMEEFLATICTPDWHAERDRGRDTAESCAELAAANPAYSVLIWAWAHRTEEIRRPAPREAAKAGPGRRRAARAEWRPRRATTPGPRCPGRSAARRRA